MDLNYEIFYEDDALNGLDKICGHILDEYGSVKASNKIYREIVKSLEHLRKHPRMYPEYGNKRKCVVGNFIALHRVEDDTQQVIVEKIFYAGTNWK